MAPPKGRLFASRYAILAEIGSGGMGTVYRARDTRTGRAVAIKILHRHLARDAGYLERFRREAKIALALDSRHIVQVLDFGQESDSHYLVMEYVEGVSLRTLLRRRGGLPPQEALAIAVQVARGLEEAHSKGVVHRDIKPENIIVAQDGTVKVADFGVARAQDYSSLTITGALLGTVQYMAPEALAGSADARSDIYSLGVVLYQMLAGSPPFDAETPWEVMRQHREEPPPPLKERLSALSEAVVAAVERCLAKEPDQRFQTALELRRALEAQLSCVEEARVEISVATPSSVKPNRLAALAGAPFRLLAAAARSLATETARAWSGLARVPAGAGQQIRNVGSRAGRLAARLRGHVGGSEKPEGKLPSLPFHRRRWPAGLPLLIVAILVAVASFLLVRWSLEKNGANGPSAGGEVERLISVAVPWGWTLDDSLVSTDGQYIALTTTGPARTPVSRGRAVAVYRRGADSLIEVARFAVCCAPGESGNGETVSVDGGNGLNPDQSGFRYLSVTFDKRVSAGEGSPSSATVTIDPAGVVSVRGDFPYNRGQTPVAEARITDAPAALVTVTPAPQYAPTPEPAVTVPAGAVPPGWTVKEAVWSPDGHHLAIVTFGRLNQRDVSQLSVYSLEDGRLRELWREVNAYIHIDEEFAFRDINGDGAPEVVYETGNGGNGWTWHPTLALALTGDGDAQDLVFRLPIEASSPTNPIDLDGDGIYEWFVIDASWEARGFCHACSPSTFFILSWDGQQYADASSRFTSYYQTRILEAEESLSAVDTQDYSRLGDPELEACARDEQYMSSAVSLLLNYGHSRRAQEGWARYAEIARPENLKTQWWKDALPALERNLELSVPKDGEPPREGERWSLLNEFGACWQPASPDATPSVIEPPPLFTIYAPKDGETICSVAQQFGLKPESILWNNPGVSLGWTGQIRVPVGDGVIHEVQEGETIRSIADLYKASEEAIAQHPANRLQTGGFDSPLQVAQLVFVPDGTPPVQNETMPDCAAAEWPGAATSTVTPPGPTTSSPEVPVSPLSLALFAPDVSERTVTLNGQALSDQGPITRIHVDWGDQTMGSDTQQFPETHVYSADGTYEITVTAWDSVGASATEKDTVSVRATGGGQPPRLSVAWQEPTTLALDALSQVTIDVCNEGADAQLHAEETVGGRDSYVTYSALRSGQCLNLGVTIPVDSGHIGDGQVSFRFYLEAVNGYGTDTYDETHWIPVLTSGS